MRALGRIVAAAALALSAALLGVVPVARGGCVGPVIGIDTPPEQPVESASPVVVDRSSEITVAGKWFFDGCSDAYVTGGCLSRPQPLETQIPKMVVDLLLTQGSRTRVLGVADAGPPPEYPITWRIRIPAEAADGPAIISAEHIELPVTITR